MSSSSRDSLSLLEKRRFDKSKKSVELTVSAEDGEPEYALAFGPGGIGLWRRTHDGVDGGYEWHLGA